MDSKNPGLRRYLYEHLYYTAVGKAAPVDDPVSTTAARRIRSRVTEILTEGGHDVDDPRLGPRPFTEAVDTALGESIEGYTPQFSAGTSSPTYVEALNRFTAAAGVNATGPVSERLLVSPYDPRWSDRLTVRRSGSRQLMVESDLLEHQRQIHGEDFLQTLTDLSSQVDVLWRSTPDGSVEEAGPMMEVDDVVGLTALSPYMVEADYNRVRNHVLAGFVSRDGLVESSQRMSQEAIARSVAVFEELNEQGTEYKVVPDSRPGQIKAQLEGSRIEVRLTDVPANENFVGRVYDDGASFYFTTNVSSRTADGNRQERYVPSPSETVDLLRFAQGMPVAGPGGQPIGVAGLHNHPGQSKKWQNSYYSSKSHSSLYKKIDGGHVVLRRDATHRTERSLFFADSPDGHEKAQDFLTHAIDSARSNLGAELDVERILEKARTETARLSAELDPQDPEAQIDWSSAELPEFSGDSQVGDLQRSYWDVAIGRQETLVRPGVDPQEYAAALEAGEFTGHLEVLGDPEEMVRAHVEAVTDHLIGTWERDYEGKRFDPIGVARYMDSSVGAWGNNLNLVAATRALGIPGEELRGETYQNKRVVDQLIEFDPATARSIEEIEGPVQRRMAEIAAETVRRSGMREIDVKMDAQGIIQWKGSRATTRSGAAVQEVTGLVGQVFEPGEHGEVTTGFAGGDNYLFVPGYEARVLPQKPGEHKSMEERTRLRGYEQVMADAVRYEVSRAAMSSRSDVGGPTDLNSVYRRLYDFRHPEDFLDRSVETGLEPHVRDAILATEARRVRYGKDLRDGSTIAAEYDHHDDASRDVDLADDNFNSAWKLTGGRNLAVMTAESDGWYDPVMTSGGTQQGLVRYLVTGAQVNADGSIAPSSDEADRAPLMKLSETETMRFDAFDRQQMTAGNLLRATQLTEPVRTAMVTTNGWTADDPLVVSQRFAREHQVPGVDGRMRDLVPGDKLSDLHGNKGVVSLVVDPQMDPARAAEEQLEPMVKLFAQNPELDVVMSPFSAVSRFNGGTARDLMADPGDLVVDGQTMTGRTGTMRFVTIAGMGADKKTKIYEPGEPGRKISSQLAWALGSKGAESMMAELYGPNDASLANVREMLITTGLDIEPDGMLREGYSEHTMDEQRRVFAMEPVPLNVNGGLDTKAARQQFGTMIGHAGGMMELPFPLNYPTGKPLAQASEGVYHLPVLSAHLRSGREMVDGTVATHDYTNRYVAIHEQSARYRMAMDKIESGELSARERKDQEKEAQIAMQRAQLSFDKIIGSVIDRHFSGKTNAWKEQAMSSRAQASATSIWSSDPRLDLDQVGMGAGMAESLGLSDDDYTLVFRDPVLRDSGVRFMRVKTVEDLEGVTINPVSDKCFDGDFDGDTVGVVPLHGEKAIAEAKRLFSMEANLLDRGSRDAETGQYPLAFQNSLDAKVAQHHDPELAQRHEDLVTWANDIQADLESGDITSAEALESNQEVLVELSEFYRDATVRAPLAQAALDFSSPQAHLESVRTDCVETGAKGSMGKLASYGRYLGVDPETGQDTGEPLVTRQEFEDVQYATAVKAHGTGIAGAFAQRGVAALRNQALESVLELTYPATQSVLQAKHDSAEARMKYENLRGPARDFWRGREMTKAIDGEGRLRWSPARDEKGRTRQADPERWARDFQEFIEHPQGLNVRINPDHVQNVAAALTDSVTGTIQDLESEEFTGGSTMDKLAYGGTFTDLHAAAARHENLFAGKLNSQFAPFTVRHNARELDRQEKQFEAYGASSLLIEEVEIKQVVAKDTQADGSAKGANRRSRLAAGRTAERRLAASRPTPRKKLPEKASGADYEMEF